MLAQDGDDRLDDRETVAEQWPLLLRRSRRAVRERRLDPLLEPRRRSPAAASRRSASVVIPSSCQIFRAVFGPSPGSRVNATTSPGTRALCFVSAWISPSSTIWTIFSSIVLPIPGRSFALPSRASSATRPDVSRTRAAARR
jgi:hypothetical protein